MRRRNILMLLGAGTMGLAFASTQSLAQPLPGTVPPASNQPINIPPVPTIPPSGTPGPAAQVETPPPPPAMPRSLSTTLQAVQKLRNQQQAANARPGAQPTTKPESISPTKPEGSGEIKRVGSNLVNFDFVNADIAEIAKSISELTKRNFILGADVHGKVTIISPKPVTVEEAYQAFISALAVQNFTVIPAGKMYKILPLRDMKNNPIPTNVDAPIGGDDAFVTRLIPIRYINSSEIVKSLRGLLTKNGDLVAYDPTNTLIITDSVGNIRRMIRIINLLDRQGNEEAMEVIKVKFAAATDVADKVMQIFDLKGGQRQQPVPGAQEMPSVSGNLISKIIPDDRTNSIIVMANQESLRRVKDVIARIDQSLEAEVEKGRIHVHYLQYADASELVGTLGSLTGSGRGTSAGRRTTANRATNNRNMFTMPPGASGAAAAAGAVNTAGGANASIEGANLFDGDVRLTADVPTNSLVITSAPADYKALLPVIRKLDIRRPQAFVEAMIMEVDIDKSMELGVAGHLGKQFNGGNSTVFGATQFGTDSSLFLPTTGSALQGLTFGLQGRSIDLPVGGGQSVKIPVYGALFRTLQSNGTINVLSTPNILTSDNKEAEIVVGQVVPFITAQGRDINNQPINQIQRENVAITLRVTPQINDSDDITMDIFQEIQDLVPGADIATFGPTTSNRSAKTTVVVRDGQTVTVGGLISDREQDSVSKVPVLGDIPIIGWFFKNKTRSKRKTSLMIFITPHIIRAPEDLEAMSIRKNEERQRFLGENNVGDHPGLTKYDMDRSLVAPKEKVKNSNAATDEVTPPEIPPTPAPAATSVEIPTEPTEPTLSKEANPQ